MTYLLDTNIISAHLRRPAGLQHHDRSTLAHDLIVVTDNTGHFAVIPGLRLENWLGP